MEPPLSLRPEAAMGWRVAVYWSGDDAWFRGHVSSCEQGELHVQYDDGDRDTVVLGIDRVRFLSPPRDNADAPPPPYVRSVQPELRDTHFFSRAREPKLG